MTVPMTVMPTPVAVAPTPMAVMPAPMAAMPAPVMTMPVSPVHLFRLEVLHLRFRCHGRSYILISGWQPLICGKRRHHERGGPRGRGKGGSSGGKSDGEFQKVAAFHNISLTCYRE